jgi:SAM-dependent methyltransferase
VVRGAAEPALRAALTASSRDDDPVPSPAAWRPSGPSETRRANRAWWDAAAAGYQAENADVLGVSRFVWGPEGLTEPAAGLIGPVAGRCVLELGCGAAQCSRWLSGQGARVVGLDLSRGQLDQARLLSAASGDEPALVEADATALPFRDGGFDAVVAAYGALPFVADSPRLWEEVARVLRPGGRAVLSTTHPVRWAFPDDPGPAGLTAYRSYFDRTPYVEQDAAGRATYVEHHRTVGDHVRDVRRAGLLLEGLVEPEWPDDRERTWGAWSPLRGRLLPGTLIVVAAKP